MEIPALGSAGEYRTRNREVIADIVGAPVAEMSVVPPLYVARTLGAQRKARPLPDADRHAALVRAAAMFGSAEIAGLDLDGYMHLVSRVSGLPITVVRADVRSVIEDVAEAIDTARPAQPSGAARDRHGVESGAVWTRRGETFAVLASGNAPGIHGLWPQALALGYRVAVRPSRREPFTAQRLIIALRENGFRDDDVVCLPTDYAGADEIVGAADVAMVYGGDDVAAKYAGDQSVWVNGPGRTKILITAGQDWRDHLDVIVDSIAAHAGTACVNATAVLFEGDPEPLAHALADRLSTLEPMPLSDERAVLPAVPTTSAAAIADFLRVRAAAATPLLGADQVVADLGDGSAALRPAAHLLPGPDPGPLNTELAFPCVWIAPWSRDDGLAPLRRSLVVVAATDDDDLVDDVIKEPTIANVYRGWVPTHYTAPGVPRDGFLAERLMRCKGYVRR